MFNKDIKIYGKHAYIIKKYSSTSQQDNAVEPLTFSINHSQPKITKELFIFKNMFDALTTGMLIGIKEKKKSLPDNDKKYDVNILASKLNDPNSQKLFTRIYQTLILTSENKEEEKIKRLFLIDSNVETELIAHAYAGLEIIHQIFENVDKIDDFSLKLSKLLQ